MFPRPENLSVEVADLKQQARRSAKRRSSRPKIGLSMLFGLTLAVVWHFVHQAGEIYQPSPTDPQFWFHLLVEGTIALYAAAFCFIAWTLWERFKA